MRVLVCHLEVELSEDEELTLDHTVPQLPELVIQLHGLGTRVEEPARKRGQGWYKTIIKTH